MQCENCGSMQFSEGSSPVLAGRFGPKLDQARAERAIRPGEHGCLAFETLDDFLRIAVPYVREGLANGEQVITVLDMELDLNLSEKLSREERKMIISVPAFEQYGGRFDPDSTVAKYEQMLQMIDRPVRVLGGMDGPTLAKVDPCVLREYEQLGNTRQGDPGPGVTSLCVYDASACGEEIVKVAHETHPIVAGKFGFKENPLFQEPESVLA